MGDCLGDQEFNLEIRRSIDQGFSGISTFLEIAWEINRKIVIVKGLVAVASPLGHNWGIVAIQIDTTVDSISPIY